MVDQTSNIFDGSDQGRDQGGDQAGNEPSAFQVPESLGSLVGEGKKFSDLNKAMESIPYAQTHIEKLEQELADTRSKLEARTSVEEALQEFKSRSSQDTPTSQAIDLNEIDNLIEQRLTQRDYQQQSKGNIDVVVKELTGQFGSADKAEEAFEAKAKEIGVDIGFMNDLAAKSPKAALALFTPGSKVAPAGVTTSSLNTEAFGSQPRQPTPVKGVMHGSSTSDVLGAWRAATAHVKGD